MPSERDLRDASLELQVARLREQLQTIFEPPLLRFAGWLDRQLRRSPRFYAWLSR